MSKGTGTKRAAPPAKGAKRPAKKQKTSSKTSKPSNGAKAKSKAKVTKDLTTIPVPAGEDEEDVELSDQDYELAESLPAAAFLTSLDKKGLSRSKKETERLHKLSKPAAQTRRRDDDDLPSIDSHSEDGEDWDSAIDDLSVDGDEDSSDAAGPSGSQSHDEEDFSDSDAEMEYESRPRQRRNSWEPEEGKGVSRLPIKHADGRIQKSTQKVVVAPESSEESEESEDEPEPEPVRPMRDDVATGARFGRPAVVDVISKGSRKDRIQAAREQIAGICQEILGDPENSLGLLRRLHTFSLASVSTPVHPEPVTNDPVIRRLALLSQLVVFKDVIPGYRIRSLSDKEKTEKVSQAVMRTREWEQGLVGAYQYYLRGLEAELKGKTELADVALQSMCTLLKEVTHFNFRTNLLSSVIARLSKKSWDESSELCLTTLIAVFRADLTGQASLEAVRLLNRMIKERRFAVHPHVLSCLLHLRLQTELGIRASEWRADKEEKRKARGKHSTNRSASRRAKGKAAETPHLSKKTKKVLKENKEIESEMQEAAAEVDKEEKANAQTETLKLLFVLYFRILKNDQPTPLLSAALRGISRYAHNVNVDFFRDLMTVLKGHIAGTHWRKSADDEGHTNVLAVDDVRTRLDCIVAAFELLSGQGEALSLDLGDFIQGLYGLLLPLGLDPNIETIPQSASKTQARSTAELLFRALELGLNNRSYRGSGSSSSSKLNAGSGSAPAGRCAAFSRRLLGCALAWPGTSAARAVHFVRGLIARDRRLLVLLDADEAATDGVWRPEIEDPDLANALAGPAWEVRVLGEKHVDERVRAAVAQLLEVVKEG